MPLQYKFKFGSGLLAINAKDEKQLIEQVSFWDECPRECGACQSKNIGMKHRVAGGYHFYELICRDCGYLYALGQKQDGTGLYPRGNKETGEWEPPYQGNDGGGGGQQHYQEPPPRQQTRQQTEPPPRQQQRAQGPPAQQQRPWDGQGGQQNRQPPARQQQGPPPGGSGPIQDGMDDDDIPF